MAQNCQLLDNLSVIYKLGAGVHRYLSDINVLRKTTLPVPVIGVGNLSFGGSGKTLVVEAIARKLLGEKRRVGIVCRSYGAEAGPHLVDDVNSDPAVVGDEAAMVWDELGAGGAGAARPNGRRSGAAVASGVCKTEAARRLIEACPDLDVVLVDDAFQHHRLKKDLNIVIWPKPGAMGREFLSAERHADILLVPNGHRSPRPESETVFFVKEMASFETIDGNPAREIPGPVLVAAGLGPETDYFEQVKKIISHKGHMEIRDNFSHRGTEARRGNFGEATSNRENLSVPPCLRAIPDRDLAANFLCLPDHADYRDGRIRALLENHARGCAAIVTTAKDAVKLRRLALDLPPIYVVPVRAKFLTNEKMFWDRIESVIQRRS